MLFILRRPSVETLGYYRSAPGIAGFFVHTALHANESAAWVAAKLAFLAAVLATMVYLSEASAA
jgi:hypothetical protein